MRCMRVPHARHLALILAVLWLVPLLATPVDAQAASLPDRANAQGIEVGPDGSIRLAASATIAPPTFGSFQRFGLYDAPPITFSTPFSHIRVHFQQTLPAGSRASLDVRAQRTDDRWTEWQIDVAPGALLSFAGRMQAVQYRATLLSNGSSSPVIDQVAFEPQAALTLLQASTNASAPAPTYRLRATRQGLVGGRTANGHIITENDFFVSLPSRRALSSLGGNEYQVRLSANGRSVVVPVWDNGPWNHHDDYWNNDREWYGDLPVGWPQDHAAYFEGYNGGVAERGVVRFPSAVDIGDGAYWALGLDGAQATVDVTFLWLGTDPGPNPEPLNQHPSKRPATRQITPPPPEPEPTPAPTPAQTPPPTPAPTQPAEPVIEINDSGSKFVGEGPGWNVEIGACASGGSARWTAAVADGATHQGVWRPSLRGGTYDVYAYIPACSINAPASTGAAYIVQHAAGHETVSIDQAAAPGSWTLIGRYTFAAGTDGYVQLRNDHGPAGAALWFDSVKWVPVTP